MSSLCVPVLKDRLMYGNVLKASYKASRKGIV
jgi:hypothetical protein